MLEAKGWDTEKAKEWADKNLGSAEDVEGALGDVYQAWLDLPENVETKYKVETEEAEKRLAALKKSIEGIPAYKSITLETITLSNNRVISFPDNENGGMWRRGVKAFENGGFPSGIYAGGQDIHKFAEKTLPWEAYISPKPDKRAENIGIWQKTGQLLGVQQSQSRSGDLAVYVQNPFTGEYLLSQARVVAADVIRSGMTTSVGAAARRGARL